MLVENGVNQYGRASYVYTSEEENIDEAAALILARVAEKNAACELVYMGFKTTMHIGMTVEEWYDVHAAEVVLMANCYSSR